MINGLEFYSTNNELNYSDGKDRKMGNIIPTEVDDLLYYIDNFYFTITFFRKKSSYFHIQWKVASEILNNS